MKVARVIKVLFFIISLTACKKNDIAEIEEPISPTTGTRIEFTLDSIYLYAKQIYLWNDALPSYTAFNPRKYAVISEEVTAYNNELFDLTQLKNNPVTGAPYELPIYSGSPKYSYLTSGTNAGTTASVIGSTQEAVLKTAIINAGNQETGYIALGSFPKLSTCKTDLDNAFVLLAANSPKYLIIDLRSNGGGYVETAEYVANLVAPTTLNGKVMYTEQYNSLLQNGSASILINQPYLDEEGKSVIYNGRNANMADVDYSSAGNTFYFNKKGALNSIETIYFITSGNTASASELLISALKPYFKVKLAGTTTYGKPVGFFPINIDKYSLYLSSFIIQNADGWSDYFAGMPADIVVVGNSSPTYGDPNEICISAVLKDINGSKEASASLKTLDNKQLSLPERLNNTVRTEPNLPHMIENRLKLKN